MHATLLKRLPLSFFFFLLLFRCVCNQAGLFLFLLLREDMFGCCLHLFDHIIGFHRILLHFID
jgi:hypothetical protein